MDERSPDPHLPRLRQVIQADQCGAQLGAARLIVLSAILRYFEERGQTCDVAILSFS